MTDRQWPFTEALLGMSRDTPTETALTHRLTITKEELDGEPMLRGFCSCFGWSSDSMGHDASSRTFMKWTHEQHMDEVNH